VISDSDVAYIDPDTGDVVLNDDVVLNNDVVSGDDVVGGLTAVTGVQGADDVATVATDTAGNDVVVRAGDVVADTGDTSGATDTVGGLKQIQSGANNLNVDSAADTTTTGGLNQATGAKDDVFGKILKGAVTKSVTGALKSKINSGVNKALGLKTAKTPSVGKKLVGNIASQFGQKVAPKAMDISKLMRVPSKKRTAPLKANVSKLTPVSNISGLSTLIKGKG
jgi:hypothetical protein